MSLAVTLGEVMTLPSSQLSVGQLLTTGVPGVSVGDWGSPEVDTDTMPSCHTEQPILLPAEATLSLSLCPAP